MSSYGEAKGILTSYVKARIPFVSLRTVEVARCVDLLREVAGAQQLSMYLHTQSSGLRDLSTGRSITEDKSVFGALELASEQFAGRQNLTFIFTDPANLDADTDISRQFLDLVRLASTRGGAVFVVTSDSVWPKLQRNGMSITLDPPDEPEMYAMLTSLIEGNRGPSVQWRDADIRTAASILVGVTQLEAENIILHMIAGDGLPAGQFGELSRAKDRVFADLAGIERVDLRPGSATVGGLAGLRQWLEQERPFLTADLSARQLRPPRGVLLVGVPGCGKSLSAKAVAQQWDLPLYRLDMASILGKYVGESEGRLREALTTADHVAPCVLWIDEIEKALSGGGTDSTGVTTRLIGQFLFWLQESLGRVYVVATANDVRSLPPELLRTGRFDALFFVDLPTPPEREEIISIYLDRYLKTPIRPGLIGELVKLSEGFAGSDIDAACTQAARAEVRGGTALDDDTIRGLFAEMVPLSQTNPERIEEIRQWGRERAKPASGMPYNATPTVAGGRRTVLTEPAGSGFGGGFGALPDQPDRLGQQRLPNGSGASQGGHHEWIDGR